MKKADLLKKIEKLADENDVDWYLDRQGANHEVYKFNGKTVPIPRHKEIGETLAGKIIKQCENTL